MTEPKEKSKPALRSPRQKKTLGLQVPQPLRLPHADLIHAAEEPPPVAISPTPTPDVGVPGVVAPTPDVGVDPARTPTPDVGVTPGVAPTPDVGVRVASSYFRAANSVFDELLPKLTLPEQLVFVQLYRLSWGHQRETCRVSVPRLASRCNLGTTAVRTALRKLERDGRIMALGTDFGASNKHDRGLEYRVLLPDGTPTESVAPTRNVGATRHVAATQDVAMKYIKEHVERAPGADAPVPGSIYHIRTIAARFYERREPGYTRADLVEDVRRALIGEGCEVDHERIEEAIGGIAF